MNVPSSFRNPFGTTIQKRRVVHRHLATTLRAPTNYYWKDDADAILVLVVDCVLVSTSNVQWLGKLPLRPRGRENRIFQSLAIRYDCVALFWDWRKMTRVVVVWIPTNVSQGNHTTAQPKDCLVGRR